MCEESMKKKEDKIIDFFKKYWWHCGKWHDTDCSFLQWDEVVCNCNGRENLKKIKEFLASTYKSMNEIPGKYEIQRPIEITCSECGLTSVPKYQMEEDSGRYFYSDGCLTLCDTCMNKGWTDDTKEVYEAIKNDPLLSSAVEVESPYFKNDEDKQQKWLVIEDEGWEIVILDCDIKAHANVVDGQTKAELESSTCPCKPEINWNNRTIVHNSLRILEGLQDNKK